MVSTSSWGFVFLYICSLMTIIEAAGYAGFQPSTWSLAHATFYGDETASETKGGACGYGNLFSTGYGTGTAALSATAVTATNLCPPNWSKDSNAGGWCNPPHTHFDMSNPAFMKIADWKAGIVSVMYSRVPCLKKGGIEFSFQGNGYWLLVYVMNVGGGGDIGDIWVKGSRTESIAMTHNWGASYQAFSTLGGQSLSFKITSYATKETIIAWNVAPSDWRVGFCKLSLTSVIEQSVSF